MKESQTRLSFASDYMEGAHPLILQRLLETNMQKTVKHFTGSINMLYPDCRLYKTY